MTKKMTKSEKAFNIVQRLEGKKPAGEIVERIKTTCKLNTAAARTYLYNARVKLGKRGSETDHGIVQSLMVKNNISQAAAELYLYNSKQYQKKAAKKKTKPAGMPDISPADKGNQTLIDFRAGKFPKGELYDRLQKAGLSPEEADEMCNLEDQEGADH